MHNYDLLQSCQMTGEASTVKVPFTLRRVPSNFNGTNANSTPATRSEINSIVANFLSMFQVLSVACCEGVVYGFTTYSVA